jgi:ABC-2 type transport system permease protein
MSAALFTEFRKLNRSLAALLAVVAPALIAIFLFFNLLRFDRAWEWTMVLQNGAAIWAFFMLPMSVTALTVLVAQMEHGPRSWEHLFALPVPRWRILAAKVVCVFTVVALMSVAVLATSIGAAWAAGELKPAVRPAGVLDLAGAAALFGRMYAAACLMVAVQLWAALRFRSFVPPLILGIGGTFFAVVASSARAGVFMPWQMPVNMLASEPERAALALTLGLGGGVIALTAMMIDLGRREMA